MVTMSRNYLIVTQTLFAGDNVLNSQLSQLTCRFFLQPLFLESPQEPCVNRGLLCALFPVGVPVAAFLLRVSSQPAALVLGMLHCRGGPRGAAAV